MTKIAQKLKTANKYEKRLIVSFIDRRKGVTSIILLYVKGIVVGEKGEIIKSFTWCSNWKRDKYFAKRMGKQSF